MDIENLKIARNLAKANRDICRHAADAYKAGEMSKEEIITLLLEQANDHDDDAKHYASKIRAATPFRPLHTS